MNFEKEVASVEELALSSAYELLLEAGRRRRKRLAAEARLAEEQGTGPGADPLTESKGVITESSGHPAVTGIQPQ